MIGPYITIGILIAALLLVGWRYVLADPASAANVATAQPQPGHAKLLGTIEPAPTQLMPIDPVPRTVGSAVESSATAAPALLPQGTGARPIARSLMSYAPKPASRSAGSIGLAPEFDAKLDEGYDLVSGWKTKRRSFCSAREEGRRSDVRRPRQARSGWRAHLGAGGGAEQVFHAAL
jgi:hypothetical protein